MTPDPVPSPLPRRDGLSIAKDVASIVSVLILAGAYAWYCWKSHQLHQRMHGGGSFDDIGGRP